jgi:hypothetical protein
MLILFKEYFNRLTEMPHKSINGKPFDYEIEYFSPKDENDKIQKFNELKEYIGKLTIGDERIVYGPFNDSKEGFWSDEKSSKIAENTLKTDRWILYNLLNWFGDLISPDISPQKLPITKRSEPEIDSYKKWIDSVIKEYQSFAFNENKIELLNKNNINTIN